MANINMSLKKNEMPMQDAKIRGTNFEEVALGYTYEMAVSEAQRCLLCKKPVCVTVPPPDRTARGIFPLF